MYHIVFHDSAIREMNAAALYYETKTMGLGNEFINEIENGLSRIKQFPNAWSVYDKEYRRYLLKRFPYGLIYRIESDQIFIMAVAHFKRKPGYGQEC